MDSKFSGSASYGIDRRSLLISTTLLAGALLAYSRQPTVTLKAIDDKAFSNLIPRQVGNWRSRKSDELVVPQEDEYTSKLYENLETFVYEGKDLPTMMLLLAYNSTQQNDVHAHRPEVCYPAGGFPIVHNEEMTINYQGKSISGRYLVAQRESVFEHIVYWVRVGNYFPNDWLTQRKDMAWSNLIGKIPDGTLFRVSTIFDYKEKDDRKILQFIKNFADLSDSKLNRILSG